MADDAGGLPSRNRDGIGADRASGRRWPVIAGLAVAVAIVGGAAGYRHLAQPKPVVVAHTAASFPAGEPATDAVANGDPPTEQEPPAEATSVTMEPVPEITDEPAPVPDTASPEPETVETVEPAPMEAVEPPSEVTTAIPAADPRPGPESDTTPAPEPEEAALPNEPETSATVMETDPESKLETKTEPESAANPIERTDPPDDVDTAALAVPPRKPAAPPKPATAGASPAADAAEHYQRAVALEREGLLDQALAHYTEALVTRPDFAEALYGRGWVQIARRAYGEAIRNFTDLIKLNPGMSPAYFGRGWAHELSGDPEQAVEDYSSAIEFSPNEMSLRFNRAILNIYREDFLAAERDLNAIRNKGDANEKTFAQVWLFVSRARSGVPTTDILPALRTTRTLGGWPGILLDFLLDKATFDEVLAETVSDHYRETAAKECIAYYFAGELSRYQGDPANAANYYRLAVATDATDYRQYWSSKLELDRMGIAE